MNDKTKKLPIFAERFSQLRGKMSQASFSQKVGISRPTVGFYENGDRLPDAESMLKICKVCNVSSDYLLGLTDDPAPASERCAVDELELSPDAVECLRFTINRLLHGKDMLEDILTSKLFYGLICSLDTAVDYMITDECHDNAEVIPGISYRTAAELKAETAIRLFGNIVNEIMQDQLHDQL